MQIYSAKLGIWGLPRARNTVGHKLKPGWLAVMKIILDVAVPWRCYGSLSGWLALEIMSTIRFD